MNKHSVVTFLATAALALAPAAFAQSTSSLGVTVGPEAAFTAAITTNTLTKSDSTFGAFGGTSSFTYKIRTSQSSGTGSITVQVVAFGTNGPAVADLSYTCTAPSSGTPCSGSTSASTSTATDVVSFGADAHSADSGDSGTAVWSIVDRTTTKTGTYSSTATFTISAT